MKQYAYLAIDTRVYRRSPKHRGLVVQVRRRGKWSSIAICGRREQVTLVLIQIGVLSSSAMLGV